VHSLLAMTLLDQLPCAPNESRSKTRVAQQANARLDELVIAGGHHGVNLVRRVDSLDPERRRHHRYPMAERLEDLHVCSSTMTQGNDYQISAPQLGIEVGHESRELHTGEGSQLLIDTTGERADNPRGCSWDLAPDAGQQIGHEVMCGIRVLHQVQAPDQEKHRLPRGVHGADRVFGHRISHGDDTRLLCAQGNPVGFVAHRCERDAVDDVALEVSPMCSVPLQ
jgi:hypothetical protein